MHSVNPVEGSPEDDRTGRARIRDAAIARFAAQGVAGTRLWEIAEDAGVSQGLVIHHFGSKQGLRAACDEYVVATINARKQEAAAEGAGLDLFETLRAQADEPPILRYLARTLVDGSPEVVALVDGMVEVAEASLEAGVRSGMFEPVEPRRDVAVVLTLWSLGLMALHEHVQRLLGIDIAGPATDRVRYARPALEALRGLFTDEAYQQVRARMYTEGDEKEEGDG